jgi:KRAB domain-containing zinc finger protein
VYDDTDEMVSMECQQQSVKLLNTIPIEPDSDECCSLVTNEEMHVANHSHDIKPGNINVETENIDFEPEDIHVKPDIIDAEYVDGKVDDHDGTKWMNGGLLSKMKEQLFNAEHADTAYPDLNLAKQCCTAIAEGMTSTVFSLSHDNETTSTESETHSETGQLLDGVPRCPVCDKVLKTMNALSRHMLCHPYPEQDQDLTHIRETSEPEENSCIFPERDNEVTIARTICNKGVSLPIYHKEHVKMRRKGKHYPCLECGKMFAQRGHLKNHLSIHSGKISHACPECNEVFPFASILKKHMMKHTGERPHTCPVCGKGFVQANLLKYHMVTHTGEKPHKCTECDKTYVLANSLKKHMVTHVGEPHICPQCDASFMYYSSMKRHVLTHSQEKCHSCPLCDKKFTLLSGLKRHSLTHTGEKPHACPECGNSFAQSGQLKNHMFIHAENKPFSCPDCDKGFRQSIDLRNHMLSHTGEKPHVCTECDKKFMLAYSLKKHMKTQHVPSN